jgi:hypothetical protein
MSNDWRLPTKDELNEMYVQLHVRGRGGFKPNGYWSSSESDDVARIQYFNTGMQMALGKANHHRVRLIQDLLENEISSGLVCSFGGKYFRVAGEDEPALMTWDEAMVVDQDPLLDAEVIPHEKEAGMKYWIVALEEGVYISSDVVSLFAEDAETFKTSSAATYALAKYREISDFPRAMIIAKEGE